VPDPELPSLSYDEIRVFIANSPYTTHRRAPDEALFERSVMHIRKHGERRCFGKYWYKYLNVDGWTY